MSTETETHESTGARTDIRETVEKAASCVGKVWPLHSFVTANPLAGFEDEPFDAAVERAERLFGARGYPETSTFRKAWEEGRLDEEVLRRKLSENGYTEEPDALLERMEAEESATENPYPDEWEKVDTVLTKWLSVFLDQGRAEWSMPNRDEGFYAAWREIARYDGQIPEDAVSELPDSATEAVLGFVSDHPEESWEEIFRSQFASLPGWTAFVRWRSENDGPWQSECPISLVGYLAVRLALVEAFDAPLQADTQGAQKETYETEDKPLRSVWLDAWEESYRDSLTETVSSIKEDTRNDEDREPDAQLVFCIDTRSEIIRRHIEKSGRYETYGYAGFFGVPMRYKGYDTDVMVDSHPPLLESEHLVVESSVEGGSESRERHDLWSNVMESARGLAETLETNAATAFSYVEKAGIGYGTAMAVRTLLPSAVYDISDAVGSRVPDTHEFCAPILNGGENNHTDEEEIPIGMTHDEKVEYAANAFELMGWEEFARLVVFVGHASRTANNPHGSALDCGACAANPGGPNARVLAAICNDEEVRSSLRERGIEIPDDTVFVAGEHNTTTDEISLFDCDVPGSHRDEIEELREDLQTAREYAAKERLRSMGTTDPSTRDVERRAVDWAETRPEWGLAGNAAFVIGPRKLTSDVSLEGRSFLHSYDWRTDPDSDALEAIMTGPMLVTQWINSQYYFASVDNAIYGSGSKITQNPVGNVGVFQGNGGDIMTGLPLQSLKTSDDEPYHQPLRLSVVIHAPTDRVREIVEENESLKKIVENGWLHLSVIDPEQENDVVSYGEIEPNQQKAEKEVAETETRVQD